MSNGIFLCGLYINLDIDLAETFQRKQTILCLNSEVCTLSDDLANVVCKDCPVSIGKAGTERD